MGGDTGYLGQSHGIGRGYGILRMTKKFARERHFFFEKRYHAREAVRVTKSRIFCVFHNLKR